MPLTSRTQLADYCLRRLGAPVIEINVDDDQVSDRIDDALQYWNEYHFDGTERVYLKAQVVASTLVLSTPDNASFVIGESVVGFTSGAVAKIYGLDPDGVTILIYHTQGAFVNNEVITGSGTAFSATLAATNAFTLGNWDKGYFETTDSITGVINIFEIGTGSTGGSVTNIFDVVYQFRLTDMYDLMSTDLTYYAQMKQHLDMLDMILPARRTFRFNRKQNRVYLDLDWFDVMKPGQFIMAECYAIISPTDYPKVYDDFFLKKYATALIKRQWGANLSKFKGIQLPGGVTLNGIELYKEANDEVNAIEEEMQLRFEAPPAMMIG